MGWFKKIIPAANRITLTTPWAGREQRCPLCHRWLQDPKWHAESGMVRCRCWECGCLYEAPFREPAGNEPAP